MRSTISKNIADNELLEDNINYIVNIVNDKTLRNQIQIEVLAKNLKKKHKDVRLRIESELVTTIIEENLKLNRIKRTTIRTKLMPKINNVASEAVTEMKQKKREKKTHLPVSRNLKPKDYARTPSMDSGLGDSRPDLQKTSNKMPEGRGIERTQSEYCIKKGSLSSQNSIRDIDSNVKKSKIPISIVKESLMKKFENVSPTAESKAKTGISLFVVNRESSFVKERIQKIENELKKSAEIRDFNGVKEKETELKPDDKVKPKNGNNNMLKVLNHLLRNKYMKEYDLKGSELDVIFAFYNMNKDGTNLPIDRLEKFLYLSSSKRREVNANKTDIKNALVAIDQDHDKKITLDEFIHLLVLFFADKTNLKPRIESILQNRSIFHRKTGWLTPKEAGEFLNFIFSFYGQIMNNSLNSMSDVDYKSFCTNLAPYLEQYLYVKW